MTAQARLFHCKCLVYNSRMPAAKRRRGCEILANAIAHLKAGAQ